MSFNLFEKWYYLAANMTGPEMAMEREVAALGKRYRSQWLFPKFKHIADFVLIDDRVILEVDGDSHTKPEQIYKDLVHTIGLEQAGWRVVRCSNAEALEGAKQVLASLPARLASRPALPELQAALALLPVPVRKPRRPRRSKQPPRPRAKKSPAPKKPPAARKPRQSPLQP